MAVKDYDTLAEQILKNVGGSGNISYLTHCMTRLRMTLTDKGRADMDALKGLKGVLGAQWSGEQLQIIIGQQVNDLYEIVRKKCGLESQEAVNENPDGDLGKRPKSFKELGGAILDGITGSISPMIPILIAGGLLKLVVVIGVQLGILDASSNTGAMLNFWGDAAFYFMPVFVGGFAAKKFGANTGLGMMLGAALIYPDFVSLVGGGEAIKLFGLPVYGAAYSSTLLPAVLCVWVMSYVEKFFAKHSPASLRAMLEPFLTMLVMVPLSVCLLAPIATVAGNAIAVGLNWLMGSFGFIGMAIIGIVAPLLVITGMHVGLLPFVLQQLAEFQYMTINIPLFINNFAQGAACFGVAVKTKDKDLRAEAITCGVAALTGGISEPALFGISLQKRTPLYASMIGISIGSAIAGIFGCKMYFFTAAGGFLGLPAFIGDNPKNLLVYILSFLAAMAVTFILTMFLYRDTENGEDASVKEEDAKAAEKKKTDMKVCSPLTGKAVALSEVKDEVFSSGMMGKGLAIIPSEGRLYAPSDGVINTFFPTGHAIGLTTDEGVEILMHVGMDTVSLNGDGFTPKAKEGDRVKKGELLLEFDIQKIEAANLSTVTPVIITNTDDFTSVDAETRGTIRPGDELIHIR